MSRILKAYRTRFHQLLRQVGARRPDQGADWLVEKARRASTGSKIPLADALTQIFEELSNRPRYRRESQAPRQTPSNIRFFCDAGLGGLARWLRAAGYEADWEAGIDDDALLARARTGGTTLLTTDSMLMERRVLRDTIIPSMWLPPTLRIGGQLERVVREFRLSLGHPPRCMHCGGRLVPAEKLDLRDRIPSKTFRWLNDYFLCDRCGQLFWHGSHWLKIQNRLRELQKKIENEARSRNTSRAASKQPPFEE
jgi:uncharacterized protein with PIN domain